jgi:hypothetical protein
MKEVLVALTVSTIIMAGSAAPPTYRPVDRKEEPRSLL